MTLRQACTGLAVALTLLARAVPTTAQVATGTVSGTVKDAQGGVIPGATVTLTNERQGTALAPAVTNYSGDYVFPNVRTGTYTIEVAMAGFANSKRTGVAVSAGDRVAVQTFTLEVAGAAGLVKVTAAAPLIQSQSGERPSRSLGGQPDSGAGDVRAVLAAPWLPAFARKYDSRVTSGFSAEVRVSRGLRLQRGSACLPWIPASSRKYVSSRGFRLQPEVGGRAGQN